MLKKIEIGEWGQVNKALKVLRDKTDQFLKEYDKDGNEEVDINELIEKREKFSNELNKVEEIVEAIKKLETQIIDYKGDRLVNDEEKLAKETQESTKESDEKSMRRIVKKISKTKKLKDEELKKIEEIIEKKLQKEFLGRKILLVLKKKEKKQFLVISCYQKKTVFADLLTLLPNWPTINGNCALDIIEETEGGTESQIKKKKKKTQWFNSKKEAIQEAVKLMLKEGKIELEEEHKSVIKTMKKKISEVKNEKEIVFKKELIKKDWNKIESELEEILLKNEDDNKGWWQLFKSCCERTKDKNELTLKEQLSLNNDEKAKEIKELIENLENNQKDIVIHLEENEQGGLAEREDPQEQSSTQAQIQIPPK